MRREDDSVASRFLLVRKFVIGRYFFTFISIGTWGYAYMFFELAIKVGDIVKSALITNL
jgi:hypothetical protein